MFKAKLQCMGQYRFLFLTFFCLTHIACGGGNNDGDQKHPNTDTAYARFYNALECSKTGAFTAVFMLGESDLSCSSSDWSDCAALSPGSNSWSLTVDSPCMAWNVNDAIDLSGGSIYNFVLLLNEDQNATLLVVSQAGNCSSPHPITAELTGHQAFDAPGSDFEIMFEFPLECDAKGLQFVQ